MLAKQSTRSINLPRFKLRQDNIILLTHVVTRHICDDEIALHKDIIHPSIIIQLVLNVTIQLPAPSACLYHLSIWTSCGPFMADSWKEHLPTGNTSIFPSRRHILSKWPFWEKKSRMAAASLTMLHKAFLHRNSIYRPLVSPVMDELFFYVHSRRTSRCGIKWFYINVSSSCLPSDRGYCLRHWSRCMTQTTSGTELWQRTAKWKERKKEETKENKNIWWCGVKSKEECVGGEKREKHRWWKDKKKREVGREEEMSGNTKQR